MGRFFKSAHCETCWPSCMLHSRSFGRTWRNRGCKRHLRKRIGLGSPRTFRSKATRSLLNSNVGKMLLRTRHPNYKPPLRSKKNLCCEGQACQAKPWMSNKWEAAATWTPKGHINEAGDPTPLRQKVLKPSVRRSRLRRRSHTCSKSCRPRVLAGSWPCPGCRPAC